MSHHGNSAASGQNTKAVHQNKHAELSFISSRDFICFQCPSFLFFFYVETLKLDRICAPVGNKAFCQVVISVPRRKTAEGHTHASLNSGQETITAEITEEKLGLCLVFY